MKPSTSSLSLAVVTPGNSVQSLLWQSLEAPRQYRGDRWQAHALSAPDSDLGWQEQLGQIDGMSMAALASTSELLLSPRVLCRAEEVAALAGWLLIPPYRVTDLLLPEPTQPGALYEQFIDAEYSAAAPNGCLGEIVLPHLLLCHPRLILAWWEQRPVISSLPEYQLVVQDLFRYLLEEQANSGFLLPGEGSFIAAEEDSKVLAPTPGQQGRPLSWLGPVGRHALPFLLRSLRETKFGNEHRAAR